MTAPALPAPIIAVGVTGHRSSHSAFPADTTALETAMEDLFETIASAATSATVHGFDSDERDFRVVTLLADGTDQIAAHEALRREWPVLAPLPFGRALNTAINARPDSGADARAIIAGSQITDSATQRRVDAIEDLAAAAQLFELADEDDRVAPVFLDACDRPEDPAAVSEFVHIGSRRAQVAGRIMIEQSDILIAVWNGEGTANIGGTGHTALLALEAGVPVIWLHPAHPEEWRIIRTPEALVSPQTGGVLVGEKKGELNALVAASVGLRKSDQPGSHTGLSALQNNNWHATSSVFNHAYRRVETVFGDPNWIGKFGSIRQKYERPDESASGSGKRLLSSLALMDGSSGAGQDQSTIAKVSKSLLPRFAWANGIAARLSDSYRSGMVINFALGALAIVTGVLYLPLVDTSQKWIFAALELAFLLTIVVNTIVGQRARLHGRWLETRRVAEYLRHAPALFVLGIARPGGTWPSGLRSDWPEWYAKMVVRQLGLPSARIDKAYLRNAATILNEHFVIEQRDYHHAKAKRLHRTHHSIEWFAEMLFVLAVLVVTTFLAAFAAAQGGLIDPELVNKVAKWFTVIAVALPTIAGAMAAIGYFGDFDRFADISQMTAHRLDALAERIEQFLHLPDERLTYRQLADLARATDETTFAEIQAWQAVYSGKRTTVPA